MKTTVSKDGLWLGIFRSLPKEPASITGNARSAMAQHPAHALEPIESSTGTLTFRVEWNLESHPTSAYVKQNRSSMPGPKTPAQHFLVPPAGESE